MMKGSHSLASRLEALIAPHVESLGYELLDVEFQVKSAHGGPVLRVFIDNPQGKPISFDDCVTVDHGLDALFESPNFETVLPGGFSLEVSSPGVDRPLKKPADFDRHCGRRAYIHTYRALSVDEMGNEKYFAHHQKQKNFFGILRGIAGESVEFETDNERFKIPFALIAKANLDIASQLSDAGGNEQQGTEEET